MREVNPVCDDIQDFEREECGECFAVMRRGQMIFSEFFEKYFCSKEHKESYHLEHGKEDYD